MQPRKVAGILLLVCGAVFLALAADVVWFGGTRALDEAATTRTSVLGSQLVSHEVAWSWIAFPGDEPAYLIIVGIVALWVARRRVSSGLHLVVSVGAGVVLVYLLKALVGRARPDGAMQSFPSGHATMTVLAYGAVLWMLAPKKGKRVLAVVWLALIVITGLARVAGGAHWWTDVLAGWALGFTLLASSVLLWTAQREASEQEHRSAA